jgi:hypothetical protein
MRPSIIQFSLGTFLSIASFTVLAHPGHDHTALSSVAIHALTMLSILGVTIAAVAFIRRPEKHEQQQEHSDK